MVSLGIKHIVLVPSYLPQYFSFCLTATSFKSAVWKTALQFFRSINQSIKSWILLGIRARARAEFSINKVRACADSCQSFDVGHCKTWTLDSGLDHGLDHGLDYGLDCGLEHELISAFASRGWVQDQCMLWSCDYHY
jgi:hypothetical protein